MITFGSGQTSGQPLPITAITLGTAQTLHTFPVGAAAPNEAEIYVINTASGPRTLTLALYDSLAALVRSWSIEVPVGASMWPAFEMGEEGQSLICNGTIVLKAFASAASVLAVSAWVDDQVAVTEAVGFGSGQTEGQPLALTATTLGAAQVVHTFPAGTANPQVLQAYGWNSDSDEGLAIHLALYNVGAVLVKEWSVIIGANAVLQPLFGLGEEHDALVCNGTTVLKAYAERASTLAISARVTTQT